MTENRIISEWLLNKQGWRQREIRRLKKEREKYEKSMGEARRYLFQNWDLLGEQQVLTINNQLKSQAERIEELSMKIMNLEKH